MRTLLMSICLLLCGISYAQEQKKATYIIGAEDINYYPHYNFKNDLDKGYAWALLSEFAKQSQYEFVYQALPIRRLQKELLKGTIDFSYPDNPRWKRQKTQKIRKKYFSRPLVSVLSNTMVKPERLGLGLKYFKSLGVPLGFNPVMWNKQVELGEVSIVGVKDAHMALQMAIKRRIDGADVEYNVASHLLGNQNNPKELVPDLSLPHAIVGFQLSTIKHQAILQELDTFTQENPELVAQLKKRYRLTPPEELVKKYTLASSN